MSKLRTRIVAFMLSCGLGMASAASADQVAFTPDPADKTQGSFSGQIPIASVGSLKLPQGLAIFSGRTIEIEAVPEWLFDRDAVLTGVVIRSSMTNNGANGIFNGLVYFNNGTWLRNLAAPPPREAIKTTNGGTIGCNIQSVMSDGFEVLELTGGRRKVLFSEIEDIVSPRAFKFAASADAIKLDPASTAFQGQSMQLVFAASGGRGQTLATRLSVPASHLPGTEGGVPNSVIASEVLIDVAMNVIAPTVAMPLVFFANRNDQLKTKLRAIQADAGTFGPINP